MRGWTCAVAAVGAVCLGSAERVDAQRLIPQIGLYVPVNGLGQVAGVGGAYDLGKKESTRAYGLGIEFGSGSIGLRGSVAYATDSKFPISGVGCTACAGRSSMLAATGGVVLRPFRLFFIEPYFLGGLGIKHYELSSSNLEGLIEGELESRTDRAYQLGIGGELGLGVLSAMIELSDFVSRYETAADGSRNQHDFILTIGLALGG